MNVSKKYQHLLNSYYAHLTDYHFFVSFIYLCLFHTSKALVDRASQEIYSLLNPLSIACE